MSFAYLAIPQSGQPCRWCKHYGGPAWGYEMHAWCLRDGDRRVQASASTGCAFWEREPGTDDDASPVDPAGGTRDN